MAMWQRDEDVRSALDLIENARLEHPLGPLLHSFVQDALNPKGAAKFVLSSCSDISADTKLKTLVNDWTFIVDSISKKGSPPPAPSSEQKLLIRKRDNERCCITGRRGSFLNPLTVTPILSLPTPWVKEEDRVVGMLGAFFGGQYCDWWLDQAEKPDSLSPFKSYWLVSKSAAKVFAEGKVKLNRLQNSMIEYEVESVSVGNLDNPIEGHETVALLGDHSRMRVDKVDPRFIGTQARLSTSIRLLDVSRQMANDRSKRSVVRPPPKRWISWTGFLTTACLSIWLLFPGKIRLATYRLLRQVGRSIYGKGEDNAPVQRLPFGMYLKYERGAVGFQNEYNALQTVRKYTSIPVPRPLDFVVDKSVDSDGHIRENGYLLTSRVPGLPFSLCSTFLADEDLKEYVTDMQSFMTQLRAIPKKVAPDFAICNVSGGPCRDTRIRDATPMGPFVDEEGFSNVLRYPDDRARNGHSVYFTHADLNPRNVLLDQGSDGSWRISGIVDWENSGYYPEYWDYTKSLFEGFRWPSRVTDTLHAVWKPFGYEKEFEIEKKSWEEGDGI